MVSITPKSRTLSNGTANDATPVEANFTELYNNDTTLANAVTTIENGQIITGKTLSVRSGFAGAPLSTDNILFQAYRGTSPATAIRWNEGSQIWDITRDGSNYYEVIDNQLLGVGLGHAMFGHAPAYVDSSQTQINPGVYRSDDGTDTITISAAFNISLSTSGLNGLDTGTRGQGWYYVWVIKDPTTSTVGALYSVSRTAPTLPAGYTLKRMLPFAIRTDASGNILAYDVSGYPFNTFIRYRQPHSPSSTGGWTNIVNGYNGGSFTVSCAGLVPPISTFAMFYGTHGGSGGNTTFCVQMPGDSAAHTDWYGNALNGFWSATIPQFLDASQNIIVYTLNGAGAMYLDVVGYWVNQVY